MTIEEKYQKLCDALREMAQRTGDGMLAYSTSVDYCDGYEDGYNDAIQSMTYAAKKALETVGEKTS